jgi:hypothetical protein
MSKPKSKAATVTADRPTIGKSVIVRSPFFHKPTAGILIATYGNDTTHRQTSTANRVGI